MLLCYNFYLSKGTEHTMESAPASNVQFSAALTITKKLSKTHNRETTRAFNYTFIVPCPANERFQFHPSQVPHRVQPSAELQLTCRHRRRRCHQIPSIVCARLQDHVYTVMSEIPLVSLGCFSLKRLSPNEMTGLMKLSS